MDWLINYVIPLLITVISGVLVYLFGELLNTIWLQPLQSYKKLKHDIAKNLSYYANIYTNVMGRKNNNLGNNDIYSCTSDRFRELACELDGFMQTLARINVGIPPKKKLREASRLMIGLSNSLYEVDAFNQNQINYETAKEIRALLGIYGD